MPATLLREVTAVIRVYHARGLVVRDLHSDSEFECLRQAILPIAMNVVPPDSHVGEVERSIRTIKERLRSCVHGLPFKRLPKLMIQSMVADAVRCLNSFPWRYGISATLSPTTIVTGAASPDYNCMRLELGAYVQVFEDNTPTNTPRARSLGAIALRRLAMLRGITISCLSPPAHASPDMPGQNFPSPTPPSPVWRPSLLLTASL